MKELEKTIVDAWDDRRNITPKNSSAALREAITETVQLLDCGKARVAEPGENGWNVNEWLKMAVLLSFRIEPNRVLDNGVEKYYDKVPLKFDQYDAGAFASSGFRVVPPAVVRRGAYLANDVVLMPSYSLRR